MPYLDTQAKAITPERKNQNELHQIHHPRHHHVAPPAPRITRPIWPPAGHD